MATPLENKEYMKTCLVVANDLWSDQFIGEGIRQMGYSSMSEFCDDSRELLGYRSLAVTQIAIALFRDYKVNGAIFEKKKGDR